MASSYNTSEEAQEAHDRQHWDMKFKINISHIVKIFASISSSANIPTNWFKIGRESYSKVLHERKMLAYKRLGYEFLLREIMAFHMS